MKIQNACIFMQKPHTHTHTRQDCAVSGRHETTWPYHVTLPGGRVEVKVGVTPVVIRATPAALTSNTTRLTELHGHTSYSLLLWVYKGGQTAVCQRHSTKKWTVFGTLSTRDISKQRTVHCKQLNCKTFFVVSLRCALTA